MDEDHTLVKKKSGGLKGKAKAAAASSGEIRTPRDAGIDYIAQWEGKRQR